MNSTNPQWGAPRIHGALLRLGIEISQATVAKYMLRRRRTLCVAKYNSSGGRGLKEAVAVFSPHTPS